MTARIEPYGEGAVLVVLGDAVDLATARRARRLAAEVTSLAAATDGWQTPVQGTASVLVPFDPLIASADELTTRLTPLVEALLLDPGPSRDARLVDVPVRLAARTVPTSTRSPSSPGCPSPRSWSGMSPRSSRC